MYKDYAALRDARAMTDADVERETGVRRQTLSDWKAGRYTPKVNKLAKIAKRFHVPLEQLIGEVD